MIDLPGLAIYDMHFRKSPKKLYVHDEFGPKVEMPIQYYFRSYYHMPELERKAIGLCQGEILEIGAGAGAHALELQRQGKEITALEISPLACEVMAHRGVTNVINEDIFNYSQSKFDTLLLLMNGIGLCGTIEGLHRFLDHVKNLLKPNGRLVFDSCDIMYMYESSPLPDNYYGEARVRYEYKDLKTNWFNWLYIDFDTLEEECKNLGWEAILISEDNSNQYLASLRLL